MHCKWFFLQKCIANDFYNENALQMILQWKCIANDFYYKKCIANDFYNDNALQMIFYNENALQIIFTMKMHCKWFLQ